MNNIYWDRDKISIITDQIEAVPHKHWAMLADFDTPSFLQRLQKRWWECLQVFLWRIAFFWKLQRKRKNIIKLKQGGLIMDIQFLEETKMLNYQSVGIQKLINERRWGKHFTGGFWPRVIDETTRQSRNGNSFKITCEKSINNEKQSVKGLPLSLLPGFIEKWEQLWYYYIQSKLYRSVKDKW